MAKPGGFAPVRPFGSDGVKNHIGSEQFERGVQMHQFCPPLSDVLLKLEDLTRDFGALVP
jgi:hypothetical protein